MITSIILSTIIIVILIMAKGTKKKPPWITKDEITRLEEMIKKRGEK